MAQALVVEIVDVPEKERMWINTRSRFDECAVYVIRNAKARSISEGDALWWSGRDALWTPAFNFGKRGGKTGKDYDIKIPRIGYSGVSKPTK